MTIVRAVGFRTEGGQRDKDQREDKGMRIRRRKRNEDQMED
jgi:hypothetical protein